MKHIDLCRLLYLFVEKFRKCRILLSLLLMTFSINCSVVCEDEKQAVAVKSQLQQLARPMYSNPPVHGALIISTILGDPDLKKLWLKEVKVSYYNIIRKTSGNISLMVYQCFNF